MLTGRVCLWTGSVLFVDNVCVVSHYRVAGGFTALHLVLFLTLSLPPPFGSSLSFILAECFSIHSSSPPFSNVKQRDSPCFLTHAPPAAHPRPTES